MLQTFTKFHYKLVVIMTFIIGLLRPNNANAIRKNHLCNSVSLKNSQSLGFVFKKSTRVSISNNELISELAGHTSE
jgi:hypothetical protein